MVRITEQTKPIKINQIKKEWYEIDLKNKTLGRITNLIAKILQGKHKSIYVPYLDCGDYVVAINADKIKISGKKRETKVYLRYSGYPGGLKGIPFSKLIEKNPAEIIRKAVSGMLPKNKLRKNYLKKLYIFKGEDHPYKNKVKKLSA